MKLYEKPSVRRYRLSLFVTVLATYGGMVSAAEPVMPAPTLEPKGLMGDWCFVKKRMITRYSVKEGKLFIRGGRSGRVHEADLTCDNAYTECKANTVRGWGTPVTEILRLEGETMSLTRLWGGSWKDKPYNFTYSRCPKL